MRKRSTASRGKARHAVRQGIRVSGHRHGHGSGAIQCVIPTGRWSSRRFADVRFRVAGRGLRPGAERSGVGVDRPSRRADETQDKRT